MNTAKDFFELGWLFLISAAFLLFSWFILDTSAKIRLEAKQNSWLAGVYQAIARKLIYLIILALAAALVCYATGFILENVKLRGG